MGESADKDNTSWFLDTGATAHITHERGVFSTYIKSTDHSKVLLGNDGPLEIQGSGLVTLYTSCGNTLNLKGVLHVPAMKKNLLSVRQLLRDDPTIHMHFGANNCKIWQRDELIAEGVQSIDLYRLVVAEDQENETELHQINASVAELSEAELWHARLGHPSYLKMQKVLALNLYSDKQLSKLKGTHLCDSCQVSKQSRAPYPQGGGTRARQKLEHVHTDVCGPVSVKSLGGSHYFLTFIDDYSRYTWLYILKKKSDMLEYFKEFHILAERQSENKLKCIRSDHGGEFESNQFKQYCKDLGIVKQLTVPYNPAQNGVAKRKNRTVQEVARAMIISANLELNFWAEAVTTACYVQNQLPGKATLDKTPFEVVWSQTINYASSNLRVCSICAHSKREATRNKTVS